MSESTAAAVAEREPPTTTETPNADPTPTPVEQATGQQPPAEAVSAEGAPSTGSAAPAGEQAEANEGGFEATLAKVRGKKPEAAPEPVLPGRSLDDEWADLQSRGAGRYAEIMQSGEAAVVADLMAEGLSDAQARQVWQGRIRTYLADLNTNHASHNLTMLQTLLESSLTDAEKAELGKRSYLVRDEQGRIKPYSSQGEALKLALSLREQAVNKSWEAKVEAGEYVSKADAEAIYEAGIAAGESRGEKNARSGSSGQPMNGGGGSMGDRAPDDVLADPTAKPEAKAQAFEKKYGFKPS